MKKIPFNLSDLRDLNDIKISDHFNLNEFSCKGNNCCNHAVKVHPLLVKGLEALRYKLKEKYPNKDIFIKLNCGYRCPKHNKEIGGVKNSEHIFGLAADVNTSALGLPEIEVAKVAEEIKVFKRIGVYGKSYIKDGKLIPVRGFHNKVGFIHLGIADKYDSKGNKLPSKWGDWV